MSVESKIVDIDKLAKDKFPPIQLRFNGKLLSCEILTDDLIAEMQKGGAGGDPHQMRKALAKIFNVDPDEFKGQDMRKLILVTKVLRQTIEAQLAEFDSNKEPGESVT